MKTKRVRPVLVEIKDASNIFENNDKTLSFYEYKQHASSGGKKFELILISLEDEKIEENDYYYFSKSNSLHKHLGTLPLNKYKHDGDKCFKVIARQSQISPEYISKFIEQYNNSCVLDLEIEMEELYIYPDGSKSKISRLAPNAKPIEDIKLTNGFVTIVEKEYSHNLLSNMQYYMEYCQANGYVTPQDWLNKFKHYSDRKEPISYTEEEVLDLIFKYSNDLLDKIDPFLDTFENESATNYTKEWFKENKKIN